MSSKNMKSARRTAKKYTNAIAVEVTKKVMQEINSMKFRERVIFAWHTLRGNLGKGDRKK